MKGKDVFQALTILIGASSVSENIQQYFGIMVSEIEQQGNPRLQGD